MPRIFLVEDHPITREGLRALFDRTPDLEVAGEADSGPAALDALGHGLPDLLLVDVAIRGGDGIEFTKQVRALYPDLPILVLSAHNEALYAERAVRAGATGYVMKMTAPEALLGAIRDVLDGRLHLSPAVQERLLGRHLGNEGPPPASLLHALTDRELEVFGHFGRGLSTGEVAETMMISPKTVETHRVHIKEKLGLRTTSEFVQRAALWVGSTGT